MQDIFGIYACARENIYATFRAKVIKITYRSMVMLFLGKITSWEKATAVLY